MLFLKSLFSQELSHVLLHLPFVGLKRIAKVFDLSEITVLNLKQPTVLFSVPFPEAVFTLFEHRLQELLVFLVQLSDFIQRLVIVFPQACNVFLMLRSQQFELLLLLSKLSLALFNLNNLLFLSFRESFFEVTCQSSLL